MGSRLALPLALVLAVLATVLYFVLSAGGPGRDAGSASRPGERPEAAPAPGGVLEAPDALRGQEPSAGSRSSVPERVAERTEPAPNASQTEGSVLVSGRVVDARGNPIPGAAVSARSGGRFLIDLDGSLPGGEETVTDADGRYELGGLRPGGLRLRVTKSGYEPWTRTDLTLPQEERFELPEVQLSPGAILVGHVYGPGGDPVPGAELHVLPTDGSMMMFGGFEREPEALTDADGAFRLDILALGAWKIRVHAEDHPDKLFDGLAEEPGQVVGDLRWVLEPGATISGRVLGVPAEEEGMLVVDANEVGAGFFQPYKSRNADVGADGRFTVRGAVPNAEYELSAAVRRERPTGFGFPSRSRSAETRAMAGEADVVIQYQPEAALVFQVVDRDTRVAVEEFEVSAGTRSPRELTDAERRPLREHPDGRVRFGGLRPNDENDSVSLLIRATGYHEFRRDNIALASGQELDLGQILLDPAPLVRVTVRDAASGAPVPGARVSLAKEVQQRPGEHQVRIETRIGAGGEVEFTSGDMRAITNHEGVAELTSLEGETVTLRVDSDRFAPYVSRGTRLPHGETVERTVELTPGGTALVTVVDPTGEPVSGVRVSHRGPGDVTMPMLPGMGGRGASAVTDAGGLAEFHRLEAGEHAFKIDEGGSGAMMFGGDVAVRVAGGAGQDDSWTYADVLEGGEVELTLQASARGELTGRILEAGKVLTGARIELREKGQDPTMSFFGPGGPTGRTSGDGTYRIDGIEEGDYTLSVSHPTRQMAAEYDLEVRAGRNTFDLDLPVAILEGRIVGEDGEPLAGLRVEAERFQEDGQRTTRRFAVIMENDDGAGGSLITGGDGGGEPVRTDEDGRYQMRGVLADVPLVVVARGSSVQEQRSEPVTVASGQTATGVDLTMLTAGSFLAEVFDASGDPVQFAMVNATIEGDPSTRQMSFTDDSGTATLGGLKPGSWVLEVNRPGGGDRPGSTGDQGKVVPIEIVAGQETYVPVHLD